MRTAGVGCALVVALGAASVEAQQPDRSASIEAIRQALQRPQPPSLVIPETLTWEPGERTRLGVLTLAVPDATKGEMVRVIVPIGELTTGLARRMSSAQRHRRERKAREAVERDLRDFLAQRAAK